MSIAAMTWAFRQKVPPKPKVVLLALADQADERTGRVCYGKTDLEYLSEKCSVPLRTMVRCIGALVRNGYIIRESGQKERKANQYWLCLDREASESINEWVWLGPAAQETDDGEPQDVDDPHANMARDEAVEKTHESGAVPRAIGGVGRVSSLTKLHPRAREAPLSPSFSREAQDLERGIADFKVVAEAQGAPVFVIEGTRAWQAHCDDRRRRGLPGTLPTCTGTGKFAGKRGWYMPTLFPKIDETTGPPKGLSAQDLNDFH